mgnify:CR=1 FL=1|jgi:hypothetical protein
MKNNNLPYEKIIKDGSMEYKITIENILGGLYGNIFKDNKKIHTEEISQLVYLGLVKKVGKEYPFDYLKKSLEQEVEELKSKNPINIAKNIIDSLKERNGDKKYTLRQLKEDWLSLDSKIKIDIFNIIKEIKDDSIIVEGNSVDMLLLQKKSE